MHPLVQEAAAKVTEEVHAYMRVHPESELHRQGKMFGVLVVKPSDAMSQISDHYLAAFSAKLDGTYYHEGFVPPVYELTEEPIGNSKEESKRLQRLLFANYRLLNGKGEYRNLLEIFKDEKPILSAEQWFADKGERLTAKSEKMPPSGAGECCAPKLLQYALSHGLEPVAMAEFWVGAPSQKEIRQEGIFYTPCSGRCVPILKHMLKGLKVEGLEMEDGRWRMEDGGWKPEILFEDEWLAVINKPSGLLSVPGKGNEPSVTSLLTAQYGFPVLPVHRLDQDTSGLLVVAKTPDVYKTLQAYFQRRDILKRYEAVVNTRDQGQGTRDHLEGLIDLPLLPDPYDRPRQMVEKEHGKPAITRYKIREIRDDGSMLVDFYPLTGRTHQLRVHAAHPEGLNAPIAGDRLYGFAYEGENKSGKERLMLHAAEIRFEHPVTKEICHFVSPTPFGS